MAVLGYDAAPAGEGWIWSAVFAIVTAAVVAVLGLALTRRAWWRWVGTENVAVLRGEAPRGIPSGFWWFALASSAAVSVSGGLALFHERLWKEFGKTADWFGVVEYFTPVFVVLVAMLLAIVKLATLRWPPPAPEIRDLLFGDLPVSRWPSETAPSDAEPSLSFAKARDHLSSGRTQEAVNLFQGVLAKPDLESRHYIQAWHFLRECGVQPTAAAAKDLLGVVVEVALPEGLDIVAAYADGTARYVNHSGGGVVWDAPDNSLHQQIESVLHHGKAVVDQIGPWEDPRPPAPPTGQARINMLTPSGLHFRQAPMEALASHELGGAVITAATRLMQSLIAKTEKKKG